MAKRVSNTQLTHDNWDQEVEKEEAGTFSAASEEELKTRVIKRAKRTLNTDSPGSASASPFQAFSGFAVRSSSAQPNFSFLSQSAKTDSPASSTPDQTTQNGRSKSPQQVTHSFQIATPQSLSTTSSSSAPSESSAPAPSDQDEYFKRLRNLNESVMKWMDMHFMKNNYCNFSPVFNDYKNYVQELEVKYLTKSNGQQSSGGSASSSSSFKTPNTTEWMRTAQSKSDFFKPSTPKESQKSEQDSQNEPEMLYGAGFASNTTNTSTVSYGRAKYPTETSGSQSKLTPKTTEKSDVVDKSNVAASKTSLFSSGFGDSSSLFDAKSVAGNSDRKLFTIQFNPPAVAPKVDTTDSAIKDDDDYVPPRNEVVTVSEEDAVYSKRCKLFLQKKNEYVDRGVGTLYLKPINGKTQLLIRADTNLGNVLLNILLSSSLPMKRVGKNNVLIVCVPNPPLGESGDDDGKTAVPLLVRVKTTEDADELLEMLDKYKS